MRSKKERALDCLAIGIALVPTLFALMILVPALIMDWAFTRATHDPKHDGEFPR